MPLVYKQGRFGRYQAFHMADKGTVKPSRGATKQVWLESNPRPVQSGVSESQTGTPGKGHCRYDACTAPSAQSDNAAVVQSRSELVRAQPPNYSIGSLRHRFGIFGRVRGGRVYRDLRRWSKALQRRFELACGRDMS